MIDLIALDLDGTLLTPSGQITQANRDAIAQARAEGVKVVLATGRPVPDAVHYAKEAGCDRLAICMGGAALVDVEKGQFVRRWDIPEYIGAQALQLCLGRGIELMVFAGDQLLLDPFSKASLVHRYPQAPFQQHTVVTENPVAYLQEHNLPLTKLHGDEKPGGYPLEELAALPGVRLTSSSDRDFELVADGVDKGRALALLAILWGISLEDCAAVGDSANDLEMLQAVGWPVAMGNATQSVRDAARFISKHNREDGAAQAILWCLEQRRK